MNNRKKVEVCFTPNLYDLHSEDAEIVVVIDVLRATTAMCTAFDNGVAKMIPVATLEEAFEYKKKGFIVAAERGGEIVEGFDIGNSPASYMDNKFEGETIVITTTNGTKAIHTARNAPTVVIGSFTNLDALSEWLIEQNKNVLLLGSGWKNKFCLEDTMCAGAFVENLQNSGKFRCEDDSSVAAKFMYIQAKDNYLSYLKASSHRVRLAALDLNEDIKYCLTPNTSSVIPILKGNHLVKLEK